MNVYACMYVRVCVHVHTSGGQKRTRESHFSPSTTWVVRITLKMLAFMAGNCTQPHHLFSSCKHCCMQSLQSPLLVINKTPNALRERRSTFCFCHMVLWRPLIQDFHFPILSCPVFYTLHNVQFPHTSQQHWLFCVFIISFI